MELLLELTERCCAVVPRVCVPLTVSLDLLFLHFYAATLGIWRYSWLLVEPHGQDMQELLDLQRSVGVDVQFPLRLSSAGGADLAPLVQTWLQHLPTDRWPHFEVGMSEPQTVTLEK